MVSYRQTILALADYFDWPASDLNGRFRALREAGVIPGGAAGRAGARAPRTTPEVAARVLLALGGTRQVQHAPAAAELLSEARALLFLDQFQSGFDLDQIKPTGRGKMARIALQPAVVRRNAILSWHADQTRAVRVEYRDGQPIAFAGKRLGDFLAELIQYGATETGARFFELARPAVIMDVKRHQVKLSYRIDETGRTDAVAFTLLAATRPPRSELMNACGWTLADAEAPSRVIESITFTAEALGLLVALTEEPKEARARITGPSMAQVAVGFS